MTGSSDKLQGILGILTRTGAQASGKADSEDEQQGIRGIQVALWAENINVDIP